MFRIRYNFERITLETSALWNGAIVLLIERHPRPSMFDAHASLSIEWQDWDESTVHLESEC